VPREICASSPSRFRSNHSTPPPYESPVAAAAHSFATTVLGFALARFLLGLGEATNFPACVKAVAEWFPKR